MKQGLRFIYKRSCRGQCLYITIFNHGNTEKQKTKKLFLRQDLQDKKQENTKFLDRIDRINKIFSFFISCKSCLKDFILSYTLKKVNTKDEGILRRLSILLVEDDENILNLVTLFLKRRVGTLYTAANGEEGLEVFRKQRPDIVLTDIRLPVMDGLTMAKAISEVDRNTPIIVITAFSQQDLLLKSIDIGAYKYVIKPINVDLLIETIVESAADLFQQRDNSYV